MGQEREVEVLDSTLREGEQTPGVTFSVEEKLELANLLDEFGVDYIEAGHPAVSADIFRAVKTVSAQGLKAPIVAHSRSMKEDIDQVLKTGAGWVGLFYSVSDSRLEQQFRKDLTAATRLVCEVIAYAKAHGLKVRYTPEDTIRSPVESVIAVSKAAAEAGADRISVADTVGAATPARMHAFVSRLKEEIRVPLHVHCHNDLGLAVANSLAAFEAGALCIDTTVNGLGERAGIADLAQVVLALRVHYGVNKGWKCRLLPTLSKKVEEYAGMPVSPQAPVIGGNAFKHNAGLHVSAVFHNPAHYEIVPAESVGRRRDFSLDKMAGKGTLEILARDHGVRLTEGEKTSMMRMLKSREKGETTFLELLERCRDG